MRATLVSLLFAIGVCVAGPAAAGPWLRGEGETFLAFALEVAEPDQYYTTAYAEYGLRPNLTLGLDLGIKYHRLDKAFIFALRPLAPPDSATRISIAFGVGVSDDEGALRPGVNVGRGFALGGRSGWAALQLYSVITPDDAEHDEHFDLTIGIDLSARSKLMLQAFSTGSPATGAGFTTGPSLIIEPNPGQFFQFSMLAGIRNGDDNSVKLGVWREF